MWILCNEDDERFNSSFESETLLAELSDAKYTEEEIDEVKEHWASEMLSVIQTYRR
ncbi:hypothetical protein CsatB_017914 [Cannabis sativa]